MKAELSLREGKLEAALAELQDEVRKAPQDPKLRIFLFQLLVVLGQWERALKQLQVAATLDKASERMAQVYRELIGCELFREDVFAGKRQPTVLGEPPAFVASLLKALELTAQGEHAQAELLRADALADAPVSPGSLDGTPFEWLADADSRLGPVLEIVANGRYYFLPFTQVASLRFEPPTDLRDLVWAPATLTLRGGGEKIVFIPARYPGSHAAEADALKLGRETSWRELAPATFVGSGQRIFTTDQSEVPLLDVRLIEFAADQPADA